MATAKKVKVTFLETRTVKDENAETFEEGKTYDLTPDSAEHWIKRGVAVLATDAKETPAKPGDDK